MPFSSEGFALSFGRIWARLRNFLSGAVFRKRHFFAIISNMKNSILFVPLAFILGGLVGYWSPSRDLRTLDARHEVQATSGKTTGFNVLSTLVKIPDEQSAIASQPAPNPVAEEVPSEPIEEIVAANDTPPDLEDEDVVAVDVQELSQSTAEENFAEDLERAKELWRTRAAMAKATIAENLGLSSAQMESLDISIDAMNARLKESFETLAENLKEKDEMDMELGIRMLGDVSATLADTYDSIGALADSSKREEVSDINLLDLIDPSVAKPLESMAGKIR